MILDIHCGWGPTPAAPNWNDPEFVRPALLSRGITGAFLASTLARRFDPVAGNDVVAEVVQTPDEGCDLRGWIVANAEQIDEVAAQMRQRLYGDRFVGIALYPDYLSGKPVTLEANRELFTQFRRYQKPMLIETPDADAMAEVVSIAHSLNGIKIIAAGMGGHEWRKSLDMAAKTINLFYDISGALVAEKIPYAVHVIGGVRKILFGSGAPGTDPAAVLALLDDAGISEDEKARICHGNARRLFGMAPDEEVAGVSLSPMGGES